MAEVQERLTRANRVAHLESILDLLGSDAAMVPKDDLAWLLDLLSPVATPHTAFRIAPAPQRERTQGILFDALGSEYGDRSNDPAVAEELTKITRLFYFLQHHPNDALGNEYRETLVRVVHLIRQHLLDENSTPQRPSLR